MAEEIDKLLQSIEEPWQSLKTEPFQVSDNSMVGVGEGNSEDNDKKVAVKVMRVSTEDLKKIIETEAARLLQDSNCDQILQRLEFGQVFKRLQRSKSNSGR